MKASYTQFLNQVVDELFTAAAETMTWLEFARRAGLCYSTVYRLGTRQTRYPQLRTVYLLARAAGLEVEIKQQVKRYRRAA